MLLQVKNVTRTFGGVKALDGVSLSVAEGEVHGLIGPNGAGKTTLLNVLSGIIAPSAGEVYLDAAPVHALPVHKLAAKGIARTFQNIRLFPALSCLGNVMAGQHLVAPRPYLPRLFHLPSARRQEREHRLEAMACLARVGLEAKAHFSAKALSYGERRRLEIARALASRPRLLLLDEPVAGMRKQGVDRIGRLIESLAGEGMTILLIEHNMSFVMGLSANITVLNFGRTLLTGTPDQVRRHPDVIEAYLGTGGHHA
ncbi:MAG TPA: ABC transporter ATP-binding protein [Desulfuromonadales bacterium]|nr:ABC transporter ATP-binding protein [Desulfuromonadales bacterium]